MVLLLHIDYTAVILIFILQYICANVNVITGQKNMHYHVPIMILIKKKRDMLTLLGVS